MSGAAPLPVLRLPPDLARAEALGWLTGTIAGPVLRRPLGRLWWLAVGLSLAGCLLLAVSVAWLFLRGTGIWGLNSSNVWGFAVANYVWWIGIGNAGTLISCLLLLTRQHWRASINRYAETMTLVAAAIAGLFPILHLGRPWLFYWLVPYPNVMDLWPQWRSALVWDLFAIAGYLTFSLLFWYTGLIPDLASLRDRARSRFGRLAYGLFALGWRGAARHWQAHDLFYRAMAALGIPLVISVHSVVGLDFANAIAPGWNESIFPPYFVVGAMYSGFAMVVTLAVPIRRFLGLEALITLRHFDAIGKILVLGSLVMAATYLTEWFTAWYGGATADRQLVAYRLTGGGAAVYWAMLVCNVALAQILWWPRARRSPWTVFAIAGGINIGMWLERVLIVTDSLSRSHLPSQWRDFVPTFWDWALLAGSLSLFAFVMLVLLRFLPAVSMHESRTLLPPAMPPGGRAPAGAVP
ncbi:MAG: NrfD/PsrC family molybdoenzyme membrane anchor subunit [Sneathiellaceae bacterium]